MDEAMKNNQAQTCPQCDNHCPVNALQCGRGRKYFGVAQDGHEHSREHDGRDHERSYDQGGRCGHGHPKGSLAGLLHRCGRFARHADMEEDELFQALTGEEKAALQALLKKLAANWQERYGEEGGHHCGRGHHGHDGETHHHKHEAYGK